MATSDPSRKPTPRKRKATGLIRLQFAKDEHNALLKEAERAGVTLTSWMRQAAQDALKTEDEKRFSSRLRMVEDAAERAAKGTAKLDNRVGELYAQAKSIEAAQATKFDAIAARIGDLEAALAAVSTQAATTSLMLACVLAKGATKEVRDLFRQYVSGGYAAGSLVGQILKRQD